MTTLDELFSNSTGQKRGGSTFEKLAAAMETQDDSFNLDHLRPEPEDRSYWETSPIGESRSTIAPRSGKRDPVVETLAALGTGMGSYAAGETAGLIKTAIEKHPDSILNRGIEENLERLTSSDPVSLRNPFSIESFRKTLEGPALALVRNPLLPAKQDPVEAGVKQSVNQLRRQAVMNEYQKRTAKQPWYKRVELFGSPRPDAKPTPAEEAKEDFAPSDRNIFRVLNALDPQVKREEAAVAEGHKLRDEIANAFTYQPREPESQWAMEKFGNVLDTFVTKPAQRLAERTFPNDPIAQDVARVATENAAFLLGVKGLKIGAKGATIPARAAVGLTRDFVGAFGRQLQKIRNAPVVNRFRGNIEAAAGIDDIKTSITPEDIQTASANAIRELRDQGKITTEQARAALAQHEINKKFYRERAQEEMGEPVPYIQEEGRPPEPRSVSETVPSEEPVTRQPEVPREDPSLTRSESAARRHAAQQRAAERPELPRVETPERPAPLSEAEKAAYLKELEQKRVEVEAQRKAAEEIDFGQMTEGHTREEVEEFARQAIADPTIKRVFVDGKEFAAERGLISKMTAKWSKARRSGKKEVVPEPERQVENRGVSGEVSSKPTVTDILSEMENGVKLGPLRRKYGDDLVIEADKEFTKRLREKNLKAAESQALGEPAEIAVYRGHGGDLSSANFERSGRGGYIFAEDPDIADKFARGFEGDVWQAKINKQDLFDGRLPSHQEQLISALREKYPQMSDPETLRKRMVDGSHPFFEDRRVSDVLKDLGFKGNRQIEEGSGAWRIFDPEVLGDLRKRDAGEVSLAEPASEVPSDNPFAGLIEDPASAEGARVYHQDLLDFAEGAGIKEAILDPANNLKKLKKEIPRLLEEKGIKIDDLRKEDVVDIIDAVKLEAGKITGPRKKLYAETLDHIQKNKDLDPEIFDDFDQQVRALRDLEEAERGPEIEGRKAGTSTPEERMTRKVENIRDRTTADIIAPLVEEDYRAGLGKSAESIRAKTQAEQARFDQILLAEAEQAKQEVKAYKKNKNARVKTRYGNEPIDRFDEAQSSLEPEVDPDTLPGEVKKVSVEEYLKEQEAKKETPKQMTSMSPNQFHSFLGVPPQAGRMLRKVMGAENRARGKGDGSILSRVLRSTFWRGQKTSPSFDPEMGKWFVERNGEKIHFDGPPTADKFVRLTDRNFGETGYEGVGGEGRGVSMSLNPDQAMSYSQQIVDNLRNEVTKQVESLTDQYNKGLISYGEYQNKRIAAEKSRGITRVIPLYGTGPEKVILYVGDPKHQKILRRAYAKAVKETTFKKGKKVPSSYQEFREVTRDSSEFNRALTKALEDKGYKGILHSPGRSGEFELQMFNPKDVLFIEDPRGVGDPALNRTLGRDHFSNLEKTGKPLSDFYTIEEVKTNGKIAYNPKIDKIVKIHPTREKGESLFFTELDTKKRGTALFKDFEKVKVPEKAFSGKKVDLLNEWLDYNNSIGMSPGKSSFRDIYSKLSFQKLADLLKADPNALGSNFSNLRLLRHLERRADELGTEIRDLLVKEGVPLKYAIQIEKEAKATAREVPYDPTVPGFTPASQHSTGPIINQAERDVAIENGEPPPPPLYEGEARAIGDMVKDVLPDLRGKGSINKILKGLQTAPRLLRKYGKEGQRLFHGTINNAEINGLLRAQFYAKEIESIRKQHKMTPLEEKQVGIVQYSLSERGRDMLAESGVEPMRYDQLSPKQKAAYDFFEEMYARFLVDVNEARAAAGKGPIKAVNGYAPLFTDWALATDAQFRKFDLEHIRKKAKAGGEAPFRHAVNPLTFEQDLIQRASTRSAPLAKPGHTLKRAAKGTYPIKINPFLNAKAYVNTMGPYIDMTPAVAKVNQFLGKIPQKYLGVEGKAGETRTFRIADFDPEFADAALRYLTDLSLGRNNAPWSSLGGGDALSRQIMGTLKNVAAATLGFSLRAGVIQPTAYANIAAMLSIDSAMTGIKKSFSKADRLRIERNVKELQIAKSSFDATKLDMEELYSDWKIGRARDKINNYGFIPLQVMDYYTRVAAALAAEHEAKFVINPRRKANGLSEMTPAEIYEYAGEMVRETQGSGLKSDRAAIQRNIAGKVMTLFQTFTINQANLIFSDLLGIKNPNVSAKMAAERTVKYLALTSAATAVYEMAGFNSPMVSPVSVGMELVKDQETSEKVFGVVREIMQDLPILSSATYGGTAGGALWDMGNDVVKMLTGQLPVGKGAATTAMKLGGVPGTKLIGAAIGPGDAEFKLRRAAGMKTERP